MGENLTKDAADLRFRVKKFVIVPGSPNSIGYKSPEEASYSNIKKSHPQARIKDRKRVCRVSLMYNYVPCKYFMLHKIFKKCSEKI